MWYPEAAWNLFQSSTNGCWWHHFFVDTVQQQYSVHPQKGGSSRWIVQLFAEWVAKCRYMQLLMVGYTVLITHGFLEAPRPNNHMIIMGVTSKDPWRCETNCGSNKWVCWESRLSHAGQQHVYGIDILMVKVLDPDEIIVSALQIETCGKESLGQIGQNEDFKNMVCHQRIPSWASSHPIQRIPWEGWVSFPNWWNTAPCLWQQTHHLGNQGPGAPSRTKKPGFSVDFSMNLRWFSTNWNCLMSTWWWAF